jgi:Fe-S cluster assembly protein SufD
MNTIAAAASLQHYGDTLERIQPQLPGANQPWLAQQRRAAAASLQQLGFPQRRQEAWRYTSVDRLLQHAFVPAAAGLPDIDLHAFLLPQLEAHRAVFLNGHFIPALSSLETLPAGVTVGSLKRQIECNPILPAKWLGRAAGAPGHAFSALNTAAIHDGLLIHVPQGQNVDRPIEVLHLTSAAADAVVAQSRNLLLLEDGAEATLIERFASPDGSLYFNNSLSEIILQEDARLEHVRLQEESPAAFHLHSLFVNQYAGSAYRNTGFALGGSWSRTELDIDFLGERAVAKLDGLYVTGEQQLSDVHLNIRHSVPGCQSHTNYKGLLHGRGRAVFDGRIEVKPHASKSDAHLHNANLLLSRSAEVDTKPQLEIYADDVKCSHGTTVGQLDPAQLFYLRSRGIAAGESQRLLCLGFAGEIIEQCRIAPLGEHIQEAVATRLTQAATGLAEE